MMEPAEYVVAAIEEIVTYARVSERLRSTMEAFRPGVQGLSDLVELEPALGPEINSVIAHLEEILETLNRANTFLEARFDANQAKLRQDAAGGEES